MAKTASKTASKAPIYAGNRSATANVTNSGHLAASKEAAEASNRRQAQEEKEQKSFASKNKSASIDDFKPNMAYTVKIGDQEPFDVEPSGNIARDASEFQHHIQRGEAYSTRDAKVKKHAFEKVEQKVSEKPFAYPKSTGSDGIQKTSIKEKE